MDDENELEFMFGFQSPQSLVLQGTLAQNDTAALHWAARNCRLQTVKALLAEGTSANAAGRYGTTALHCVAEGAPDTSTAVEVIAALLSAGADIEAKDRLGYTPLLKAVASGQRAIATALLEAGADALATYSEMKRSAISLAVASGNVELVCDFFHAGVDMWQKDWAGSNLLHQATHHSHVEMMKFLLDVGVPLNDRDVAAGITPVMWCGESGNSAALRVLLLAGANCQEVDREGYNPLEYAEWNSVHGSADLIAVSGCVPEGTDVETMDAALAARPLFTWSRRRAALSYWSAQQPQ